MEIHVLTGLPRLFTGPMTESILEKAQNKGLVSIHIHDIRNYAHDKYKQIDDYPYGGGAGMILKPEPIFECLQDIRSKFDLCNTPVTLMTPAGETFSQSKAVELSLRDKMIILCGHYKGIDQRVIDEWVTEELSVGDYVLTGGELPAMTIIDAIVRLLPGAIGDFDSADTDSFQTGILDHPHYTRPVEYNGMSVPDILLSGNHKKIDEWRQQQAIEHTRQKRPDLLKNVN